MTARAARPRFAWCPLLALLAFTAGGAAAETYPGFMPMITDSAAVFPIPTVPQPLYGYGILEPTFGTVLTRISGDAGDPLGALGTTWGTIARHTYSKVQPWNANQTLISIDNHGTGYSPVLLDGSSYQPVLGPCANYDHWDSRWHPKLIHSREQINVNEAGTELMWFDVVNCVKTRTWTLPIVSDYGIGSGEGNVSNSGRFVAIYNQQQMVVVDMDPPPNVAPAYPYKRIGPVYTFAACSLDVAQPNLCRVSNVSISPSGKYIDVKYGRVGDDTTECIALCDAHRIFEVDTSLAIRPHNMADASLRCGPFAARPNGWIFPLKHADMTFDVDDNNEDIIIGGRACPGSTLGHVVKVRLSDGQVTSLTNPVNEPSYSHGSARNLLRPGWFYVTYSRDPKFQGNRFWGEVVALRTDGSGQVQRFGHYHSTASFYEAEAQGVPSPDGRRVIFGSDWADHASWPGTPAPGARDFVLDGRENARLDAPTERPRGLRLSLLGSNPSRGGLKVRFTIPAPRPTALELYDLAGRRLYVADAGTLGVGEHVMDLDPVGRLDAGVYFVTLTDGHERKSLRAVVLH